MLQMRHILLGLFVFMNLVQLWSQETVITGTVTDADTKEPIIGATVVVEGTITGAVSNLDGKFTIKATKGTSLLISFMGYNTEKVLVSEQTNIAINLTHSIESLKEVVVVGYGVQKKESVVGAISQVSSKELVNSGVSTVSSALTGKLAGVVTMQNNGMPGEDDPQILVRGKSSWVSSSPLVMVDGIEREFNDINPNDIETLSVLKDASATAVYGSKGANGVILITTKRGKAGKPSMSISANQGFKFPTKPQEYHDAYTTLLHANTAMKNDGNWTGLYSPEELEHYHTQDMPYKYPSVDWYNQMVKDVGYVTDINFNVVGGTEKVKYFGSVGYLHDGDIINSEKTGDYDPRFYYDRINMRTNLDFQLTKTTSLSSNIGGSYQLQNKPTADQYNLWNSILVGPVDMAPLYYGTDATELYPDPYDPYTGIRPNVAGGGNQNPYTMLYYGSPTENQGAVGGFQKQNDVRINTDLILKQDLGFVLKGLTMQGTVSYNSQMNYRKLYQQTVPLYRLNEDDSWTRYPSYEHDLSPIGYRSENLNGNIRGLYYEIRMNYANTFGKHSVTAMGIFHRTQKATDAYQPYKAEAWAGRATYDYNRKYLAEVNIGYTGSDQFGPGNRFGFFPAYALGWNIAKEEFIANNFEAINTLKVRYSYGKAGNDNSSTLKQDNRWLYYNTWSMLDARDVHHVHFGNNDAAIWRSPYAYQEGASPNRTAQWEVGTKNNLGFELAVFENTLSLSVDLFEEHREKILMQPITIPSWVQVDFKDQNIGETKNHGFEVEMTYKKMFDNQLMLALRSNFSLSENRIVAQDNPDGMADYLKTEGKPIGVHFGFETTEEYYQSVDDINNYVRVAGANHLVEGDIKYIDYNGDGSIDANDRVPIGNMDYPMANYAITPSLNYKGFRFSFMIQGVKGKSSFHVHNSAFLFSASRNRIVGNQLDYYSPYNTDAAHPAPHYNDAIRQTNNQYDQYKGTARTSWVETDFVRLKQAELAYSFNGELIKKMGVENLVLYINGNNIFTKSNTSFGDPEKTIIDPGNASSYPLIKRYNVGLKLNL